MMNLDETKNIVEVMASLEVKNAKWGQGKLEKNAYGPDLSLKLK